MDELKKHIQQNLDLLEDEMPSSQVWNKIKSSINNEQKLVVANKKSRVISILKYAVAACIIGLAAVGAVHLLNNKSQKIEIVSNNNQSQKNIESIVKTDTQKNAIEVDTPIAVLQNVAKSVIKAVTHNAINDDTINNLIGINNNTNNAVFTQVKYVDSQFAQVINLQKNRLNNTPIFAENKKYFKAFIVGFKQMEKDEKQVKKDIAVMGFTSDLLDQLINVNQQKLNLLKMFQTEINKTNIRFKQNRNSIDTTKVYFITI